MVNARDIAITPSLIAAVGPIKRLVAEKAHDANGLRRLPAERGTKGVILLPHWCRLSLRAKRVSAPGAEQRARGGVMDVRMTRGPTRWGARTLVVGLTISMVAIAIAIAVAEFTLTPPTAQTKAALDRSAADNAAQPKTAAKTAEAQPPATEPQQPQFIYSPWTKICTKVQEANAQQVCLHDELEKSAEAAREKLESQHSSPR